MNEYIIETENLFYSYEIDEKSDVSYSENDQVLKGINLKIKRGEYISVLGHNGSGKSTLAKLLNLILIPTFGKIFIEGKDITDNGMTEDDEFEIRKKVGMVFQNPDNQLVATVVEEDVAFGPENLGLERDEIRRRVDWALSVVGMSEFAKNAPHKLSGGQKQRVAIAGIIAMKPDVIIFDESTAMLDPIGRRDVLDIMERLNRDMGITVLNITHYMEEAALADRVIVINDGEISLDGTPREVFSKVELLKSMGLEAPQGIELAYEINKCGYNIPLDVLTEEECVNAVLSLIKEAEND